MKLTTRPRSKRQGVRGKKIGQGKVEAWRTSKHSIFLRHNHCRLAGAESWGLLPRQSWQNRFRVRRFLVISLVLRQLVLRQLVLRQLAFRQLVLRQLALRQ